jgi:hypothetical protein
MPTRSGAPDAHSPSPGGIVLRPPGVWRCARARLSLRHLAGRLRVAVGRGALGLAFPRADAATADGWPGPDTVAKIYSDLAAKK